MDRCSHKSLVQWMNYCPDCGEEAEWRGAAGNPECETC